MLKYVQNQGGGRKEGRNLLYFETDALRHVPRVERMYRSTIRRVAFTLFTGRSLSGPFLVRELNPFYAGRDLVQSQDRGMRAELINEMSNFY